jgi:hypothetical protein
VSAAAAETLSARMAAIDAHSAAAGEITQIRAGMLAASGAAYAEQETTNQGGLTLGSPAPGPGCGATGAARTAGADATGGHSRPRDWASAGRR